MTVSTDTIRRRTGQLGVPVIADAQEANAARS
jgi:hypothetical protein